MATEEYFYGAGRSSFVELDPVTGKPLRVLYLGNAESVKVSMKVEKKEKRESMSGQNALVRSKVTQLGGEIAVTLSESHRQNMELFLFGKTVDQAAVTAYVMNGAIPATAAVGETYLLDHQNVSNVVIRDSAGTPVTVPAVRYRVDAKYGTITILTAFGGTGVYNITYDAAANKIVPVFQNSGKSMLFRHEGINVGNDVDTAFLLEIYKTQLEPVSDLELITDDFGKFELKGTLLADPRRASDPNFGKYGRYVELGNAV